MKNKAIGKFIGRCPWISAQNLECKNVEYRRNPTEYEIRFGEGAIHYRSFPLKDVINNKGEIKKRLFAKDDNLWYSIA